MSQTSVPQDELPSEQILRPGSENCPGCGMSIGLQLLAQALGDDKPILAIPPCCGIGTAGADPARAFGVPAATTTLASAPAVATGMSAAARLNGEDTIAGCWAGDGGTYGIGVSSLSAAADRNEDIIYFCYDNDMCRGTGHHPRGAAPTSAATTTTPAGTTGHKKDMMAIMADHRIPYAATLSFAHRDDFIAKVRKAKSIKGFRFLLMLTPCPTEWESDPADSVELVGYAVRSGLFPLYEIFDGLRYRINERPDGTPVEEFVSRQRRFVTDAADAADLQSRIRDQWHRLDALEKSMPAARSD